MNSLSGKRLSPLFSVLRLFIAYGMLLGLASEARPAHALCAAQPEEGNWANADPNTRSLTSAVLRFTCQDQVLNGQPYPPGPPWHMQLKGKCSPTDCDWGEVGAESVTVGTRTYVRAVYDQGFAKRYVYADISLYRTGQLWIWMWTDFTDPSRPDYESQNWFTRR